MTPTTILKSLLMLALVGACGPTARDKPIGGDDDGSNTTPDAPEGSCNPSPEVCNDLIDNDCDLKVDCGDIDCSGVGTCPVCGEVQNPEATPLPLPDGISSGASCAVDADCPTATPYCIIAGTTGAVIKECHASYSSILDFVGFPAGSTLTDTSKLLKVCVNMEHSYLHDLQIELITPPDASMARRTIALHKFIARTGPEVYLGEANDSDTEANPVAGVGYEYCWTLAATNEMISAPTTTFNGAMQLPAGDYKPVVPFTALMGTPLNGTWEMRVTDLYAIDNGFMFSWTIVFDPSLVEDCSGPIIQ